MADAVQHPPASASGRPGNGEANTRRRAIIQKFIQKTLQVHSSGRREMLWKLERGYYDHDLKAISEDIKIEAKHPEQAIDELAKLLNEEVRSSEKRMRKPVDRRIAGITDSPTAKKVGRAQDISDRCGVCFRYDENFDYICEVCGAAAHSECIVPSEATSDAQLPIFKMEQNLWHCRYCRSRRRMLGMGKQDVPTADNFPCDLCGRPEKHALLVQVSHNSENFAHIACAKFLPGSGYSNNGARRYGGDLHDLYSCEICSSSKGAVTFCELCERDAKGRHFVHISCALSQGGYVPVAIDETEPMRIVCPYHAERKGVSVIAMSSAVSRSSSYGDFRTTAPSPPTSSASPALTTSAPPPSSLVHHTSSASGEQAFGDVHDLTVSDKGVEPSPLQNDLQRIYVPPQNPTARCGYCLSRHLPLEECDGCNVRLHVGCASRPFVKGFPMDVGVGYCSCCVDPQRRGAIGKCIMCPHNSPNLALEPVPNAPGSSRFVHSICLSRTPEALLPGFFAAESPGNGVSASPSPPLQACSLCLSSNGCLTTCSKCPNTFHAVCLALACQAKAKSERAVRFTECLDHCSGHNHAAHQGKIAILRSEHAIGTATRLFRRGMSSVGHAALQHSSRIAAREDWSFLPTWRGLSEQTKNEIMGGPPLPAHINGMTLPADVIESTLGAISRAWLQTHEELTKKRMRLSSAPVGAGSATKLIRSASSKRNTVMESKNIAPTRTSQRRQQASAGFNESGSFREIDMPIEAKEVWPQLDVFFKRPASTKEISEILRRDRGADDVLLAPRSLAPLPPHDLYPLQPQALNPFVPPYFEACLIFERSQNPRFRYTNIQLASMPDAHEFALRNCCLGRHENNRDSASNVLLVARGMGLTNHVFLKSVRENGELDGVAHCLCLSGASNGDKRMLFLKVNARSSRTALELLCSCFDSFPKPEIAFITSVSPEQETLLWKVVFGHELVVGCEREARAGFELFSYVDTRYKDWTVVANELIHADQPFPEALTEVLKRDFTKQPLYRDESLLEPRIRTRLSVQPSEPSETANTTLSATSSGTSLSQPVQIKRSVAFVIPLEQYADSALQSLPPPTFTLGQNCTFRLTNGPEESLVPEDPSVHNTISKQIDQLQHHLKLLCEETDKKLQALQEKIEEEQKRSQSIRKNDEAAERVYKQRKRRLDDRLKEVRLQYENDANACCYLCNGDESHHNNPIIICERCCNAAHQECLGLARVPEEDWYCEKCVGKEGIAYKRGRGRPLRRKATVRGNGLKRVTQSQNAARLASSMDGLNGTKRGSTKPRLLAQDGSAQDGDVQLLCVCRAPYEEGRFMLCCDSCSGWFHPRCLGLTECENPEHENCVVYGDGGGRPVTSETGTHVLDLAGWAFKCPKCANNQGECSLVQKDPGNDNPSS